MKMVNFSLLISITLFGLAGVIGYVFLSGFAWGAGFQPTPRREIESVNALLNLDAKSLVLDLGSGTGSVLIRFAEKSGAKCVGFEIDPLKVWWSRLRIRMKRLSEKIEINRENLLSADVSKADVVYVFLSSETKIMTQLGTKLLREMKPGGKIVSFIHRFEGWEPEFNVGKMHVYSISEERPKLNS